ncbi:MAG: hypothetical protein ACI4IN_01955 [Eubacterium sp.]
MKQNNKKIIAKTILIVLLSAFLSLVIFFVCLVHNASTYVEKKYNKDVKVTNVKLPYFKDDADLFDWPILYKPGEFVPFAICFKDKEKEFTVIYNNGNFYDDYQLEEINKYMKEYFVNLTKNSNIVEVLPLDTPYSSNYYDYNVLTNILKKNNTKWTKENILELIQEIFADYNGHISLYLYTEFKDLPSLSKENDRITQIIKSEFGQYYCNQNSNPVSICFVNYDLPTKRVDKNNKHDERFDYFGFEEEQNNILRFNKYVEKSEIEKYKFKNLLLW